MSFVYALIPDFFSESSFGPLFVTIWLFLININVFVRATYVLQVAIQTICQVVPAFRRYPFFVNAALCACCLTMVRLHYYKATSEFIDESFGYALDSCVLLMFALFVLALRFLYTWMRFRDDHMFIYSRYPAQIWIIWLNSAVFFSLVRNFIFSCTMLNINLFFSY